MLRTRSLVGAPKGIAMVGVARGCSACTECGEVRVAKASGGACWGSLRLCTTFGQMGFWPGSGFGQAKIAHNTARSVLYYTPEGGV